MDRNSNTEERQVDDDHPHLADIDIKASDACSGTDALAIAKVRSPLPLCCLAPCTALPAARAVTSASCHGKAKCRPSHDRRHRSAPKRSSLACLTILCVRACVRARGTVGTPSKLDAVRVRQHALHIVSYETQRNRRVHETHCSERDASAARAQHVVRPENERRCTCQEHARMCFDMTYISALLYHGTLATTSQRQCSAPTA